MRLTAILRPSVWPIIDWNLVDFEIDVLQAYSLPSLGSYWRNSLAPNLFTATQRAHEYVSWSLNMSNILRFYTIVIEIERQKADNIVNLEMPAIYIVSLEEVMLSSSDEPLEST